MAYTEELQMANFRHIRHWDVEYECLICGCVYDAKAEYYYSGRQTPCPYKHTEFQEKRFEQSFKTDREKAIDVATKSVNKLK